MKKILICLSMVLCSVSLVHAAVDDDGWGGSGLSENECKWVHVTANVSDAGEETWTECPKGTERCGGKFCNGNGTGAGTDEDPMVWEKSQCNKYCITLQEALPMEGGGNVKSISGGSGVDLLSNYFGMWYKIGALILGLVCVLVIVISGVQIMFGGVSEEAVTSAKARIWGALLSLILLFSSALILRTINPLFFT